MAWIAAALLALTTASCGSGRPPSDSGQVPLRTLSASTPTGANVSATGPELSFPESWNSLEGADGLPPGDFAPPQAPDMLSPIDFVTPFLEQFGSPRRDGLAHVGIDIALEAHPSAPVHAGCKGRIAEVSANDRLSQYVTIDCGDGWTLRSGFLGAISAAKDQPVEANTVVGTSDPTGHFLHAEVRYQGNPVDPAAVLRFPAPPPTPTPRPSATTAATPTLTTVAATAASTPAPPGATSTPSATPTITPTPTQAPPTATPTRTATPSPTPRPAPTATPTLPVFRQ